MIKIGDYEKILSDRDLFNQVVYTPLSEALVLLEARRKDPVLMDKINTLLNGSIPKILKEKSCGVLFRQIATPNHESKRFITLMEENKLYPVFFEYHEDKFTSNNDFKHSLGMIPVYHGIGKQGGEKREYIAVVDFNINNGKKLSEINTLWSEPLVQFHQRLFKECADGNNTHFFNASEWYKLNGPTASEYYSKFILLFVCHGILFENFLPNGKESSFSRDIVLPAIETVLNQVGIKPLIVPISPLDIESDDYWLYHSPDAKSFIGSNIKK